MNIDLTPIFQAIIALLAALVTYKLIPWIKSKTSEAQQANLAATIKILVFAAEQLYGSGNGHEKLEYVKQELQKRGYTVDVSAIEATVAEYLNYVPVTTVIENSTIDVETHPPEEENADE